MSVDLVIFDCDGVLVDSEPISVALLVEMITRAGHPFDAGAVYARFLGRSMASVCALLAEDPGLVVTPADLDRLRLDLYARFRRELAAVEGVADVLGRLGRPFCVASSSQPERIRLSLDVTGLRDRFEPNIFSASMVANGKPAPDLFLLAAGRMGVDPARCVVIEDSAAGVEAARRAGMAVFAFTGGSHAVPAGLAATLAGLAPDAIFDRMEALPDLVARVEAAGGPARRGAT